MRRLLSILLLASVPALLPAQDAAPERPKLDGAAADTNDTYAYYHLGLSRLASDPKAAADAFWWSSRLDPSWADPVYARRVALLMSRPDLLNGYMEDNDRVAGSAEMQRLDSLQLRAVSLNPFLYRKLDATMLRTYLRRLARADGELSASEADVLIGRYLSGAGGYFRAWLLYADGRFPAAAKAYAHLVDRSKEKGETRAMLARVYFQLGDRPRALEAMTMAVGELRASDDKHTTRVYESKAIYEHGVALIHHMSGNVDSAKAAYGRALQEDLAYWPAHRALGDLLLAAGDTTGAIAELEQAVQLKDDDAGLRYSCGWALALGNRLEDAVAQFKRATELDPDYAAPWVLLGRVYDAAGMVEDARTYDAAYVAHASRGEAQLAFAKQRLGVLAEAVPPASARPKTL